MRAVFPARADRCIPLDLDEGPSPNGPRIGGRAPDGLRPGSTALNTRYLLTLPLLSDPPSEFSVYIALDSDEMVDNERRVCAPGVEILVHPPSKRGMSDAHASELDAHPMVLGAEASDVIESEGESVIRTSAKLGGRPFVINPEKDLEVALERVAAQGFVHILQLPSPSSARVTMSGPWPFAGGMLQLFARKPFETADWAWYWEL